MSLNTHNQVLDALVDSLAAALPARFVQRSLVDPANEAAKVAAGLLCVVTEGGGQFANYRGREGDLGTMQVKVVGYVQVPEKSEPADMERAELDLLGELLGWVANTKVTGIDVVTPSGFVLSKQLEHPYGWLVLSLDVKI
jgi:hypothetical protein